MNIGVFYQSVGHKIVACYKATEQLRLIYPNIPLALYEDGTDSLEPVAKRFNADYRRFERAGKNERHSGREVVDLPSLFKWLSRVNEACLTTLKDVEWIIKYEDDVWCKREIKILPKFDLSGANGPIYKPGLYDYLKKRFNINDESRSHWSNLGSLESYCACGGTIFRREAFIEAYKRLDEIPWDVIYKLDTRPIEWSDATLSFIIQHAGFTNGIWDDWANYDSRNLGRWWDKTGWTVPMSEQRDVAFIHLYKHYYNYTVDDIKLDL